MNNNLYTHIHTYTHTINKERKEKKRKAQRNTTLVIYDDEDYKKFKHILELNNDNVSSFLADVIQIILEQYDVKEHSLDKYLEENESLKPLIDGEPEKVLKYFKSVSMDEAKKLEEKMMRNYVYIKAITNGEIELDNFPYLWRKYH